MTAATIKVDRDLARKAFTEESGKLRDGELSRHLPGFTAIETVGENTSVMSTMWYVWYVATRVRDGKTYGFRHTYDVDTEWLVDPFRSFHNDKLTLTEMVQKTKTVVFYETAK